MDNSLIDQLIDTCDSLRVPMEEFAAGSQASGLTHQEFCDAVSRRVAFRYLDGSLDFDDANAAINNLYFYAFQPPELEPGPYMWSIYQAFDDGEYTHPGDSSDMFPPERYTRPQLLAIVTGSRENDA